MPLGSDKQYDLSWAEQDKIRRRLEIKNRLKAEATRKKYDPFNHIKRELYTDPALDRYMDLRKKGRMPGAPFKPSIFYGMVAMLFVPIIIVYQGAKWERGDWYERCSRGEVPYKDRKSKASL